MMLRDLCLDKIVEAFDRFNLAFTTTKEAIFKKGFEFLQRKYSFRIIQKLSEERRIRDEFADFLFNRHLKVLDTLWFSSCSWEIVTRKFAEIGPNLETLYHNEGQNDHRWVAFLCHIENIKVIYCQCYCDDEFLLGIAQYCHKIETLDIKHSYEVSNVGIKSLCPQGKDGPSCPILKELFIEDTAVGNDSIGYLLQHLPSLERCDYAELVQVLYEKHKADIETLGKVKPYNLTHLNLMNVAHSEHFNDILQICVSLCPNVKVLSCSVFNEKQLKLCSDFIKLEDLDVDCCTDSWIEINEFLKIRGNKLTSLGMRNFSFSASVLAVNCTRLNALRMNVVNFQYDDADSIPIMHNLREFTLEKCVFVDNLIFKSVSLFLSSSPNLEQLSFKSCDLFTSEIKTQILKCCEQCPIHLICFSNSSVEPQLFKDILLTCSTLTCMDLYGCVIEGGFEDDILRIACTLPNNPDIILFNEIGSDSDFDNHGIRNDDFFDDEDEEDYDYYDDYDGDDYDDDSD